VPMKTRSVLYPFRFDRAPLRFHASASPDSGTFHQSSSPSSQALPSFPTFACPQVFFLSTTRQSAPPPPLPKKKYASTSFCYQDLAPRLRSSWMILFFREFGSSEKGILTRSFLVSSGGIFFLKTALSRVFSDPLSGSFGLKSLRKCVPRISSYVRFDSLFPSSGELLFSAAGAVARGSDKRAHPQPLITPPENAPYAKDSHPLNGSSTLFSPGSVTRPAPHPASPPKFPRRT